MKPIVLISIILIIVGILAISYQGISYVSHDKIIDMGPLQVSADQRHTIPIAPVLGVVALVAGIVMIVSAKRI